MKVLIIAHKNPNPPRGGATLRNFNLMKECSRNHELHLITFTQEPYLRDPEKMQESIEGLRKYCKHVEVFKIPTNSNRFSWYLLLFLNLFSLQPYSVWWFWSPKLKRAIQEHLRKHSFDLVEIGTIAHMQYAKLAPDLPKLLIHHNVESELLYRRSRTAKGLLARTYLWYQAYKLRRLEKKAFEVFDYHTVVSMRDKKTLLEIGPGANIEVVDNGVDTDFFTPSDGPVEPYTIVYVGSLGWYPNAEAMIYFSREIWPLLKREIPSIKLNLVGDGPPKELVEFGKKDPAFRLLGLVDDVRPYILKSAVYVVPITVGGGTRLKILDAMALGKAIVSTSIGCEGINTIDGENIMIADTPREFVEKIARLFCDEGLRRRLGARARETAVEYYSWKKIAPKLERIYELLGNMKKTGGKIQSMP